MGNEIIISALVSTMITLIGLSIGFAFLKIQGQ